LLEPFVILFHFRYRTDILKRICTIVLNVNSAAKACRQKRRGSRFSRLRDDQPAGNSFINLGREYPNQTFVGFIAVGSKMTTD
jgi:hypothetical protein